MRKIFLVATYFGLGNRLKVLTSCRRLSRMMPEREFLLVWPVNRECGCSFENLFKNNFLTGNLSLLNSPSIDRYIWDSAKRTLCMNTDSEADVIFVNDYGFFYSMTDASPAQLRLELEQEFAFLQPIDKITKITTSFGRLIEHDAIGVHVRRTDHEWCRSFTPIEEYINVINKFDKYRQLFLATDCETTEAVFKKFYNDRLLILPKRWLPRHTTEGVEDAFVELLLLARTSVIIKGAVSTFAECSSYFGSVPTVEIGNEA